jgi:hypothetical protein
MPGSPAHPSLWLPWPVNVRDGDKLDVRDLPHEPRYVLPAATAADEAHVYPVVCAQNLSRRQRAAQRDGGRLLDEVAPFHLVFTSLREIPIILESSVGFLWAFTLGDRGRRASEPS